MKYKIFLIIGIVVILLISVWGIFFSREKRALNTIHTFEDCVHGGYPIQESYPRGCSTPDGRHFTEEVSIPDSVVETKDNLIRVYSPTKDEKIKSPIAVTGEARGYWYFEASFPVELVDSGGNVIATGTAQAKTDWMTENFVPFSVSLTFKNTQEQNGRLILHKSNASDLPEHDDSLEIPVIIGF